MKLFAYFYCYSVHNCCTFKNVEYYLNYRLNLYLRYHKKISCNFSFKICSRIENKAFFVQNRPWINLIHYHKGLMNKIMVNKPLKPQCGKYQNFFKVLKLNQSYTKGTLS